jgi:uncharacterized protein YxjI
MTLQKTRQFILSEKLVSFKDKVWVMNTNKEKLGYFIGKLIKIGNTYRLYDIQNEDNALLTVSEKIVSVRSTYSFYKGGEKDDSQLIGKLKRKLAAFRPSYWFEDKGENKLFTMKGNIFASKYSINKEGQQVAQISKKFFKIKGTYGVKIDSDVDDDTTMLILGIVVMLHHEKEEND